MGDINFSVIAKNLDIEVKVLKEIFESINTNLNKLKVDLKSLEQSRDAELNDLAGGKDYGDKSQLEENMNKRHWDIDSKRKTLKKMQGALRRFEEGDYGLCLDFEEPIDKRRLISDPLVEYCLEAQENHEQKSSVEATSAQYPKGFEDE